MCFCAFIDVVVCVCVCVLVRICVFGGCVGVVVCVSACFYGCEYVYVYV